MAYKSTLIIPALFLSTSINLSHDGNSVTRLYKNSSLELSYTYPNHIITAGVKYNPSDIGIGLSYNPTQQHIFFQTEASFRTNPCLKKGTDLFVEQLNILADQSKIKAYTQQLRKKTLIAQKKEFNYLKSILELKSDQKNPYCQESEAILKKLEAYYAQ